LLSSIHLPCLPVQQFTTAFMLQVLTAIGCKTLRLADD
jgi:hypothetical protein